MENGTLFKFCFTSIFFILIFVLGTFPSLSLGISPYPLPTKTINHKSLYLEFNTSLFTTTGRFDYEGQREDLDEGSSFDRIEGELLAKYGLGRKVEVWIGMCARQNSSQTDGSQVTSSGLESYFTGFKYSFAPISGRIRFALDAGLRMTGYSNEEYSPNQAPTNELILGDDGTAAYAKGVLTYKRTNTHYFSGFLGYGLPPGDLSHEIIYNLETAFIVKKLAIMVGVNGTLSLRTDEYADPQDKPSMSTGETNLYNSIDREYVAPYLGLNVAFKKVRLGISGSKRMMGVSTDEGYEFKAFLSWQSLGVSSKRIKINRFKQYIIEASVIKVSSKRTYVKIDQGLSSEVVRGMKFDIYKSDFFGGNKLVASGAVFEAGKDWAIIKISKKFSGMNIEEGFTARAE